MHDRFRKAREKKTIEFMVKIFCHGKHSPEDNVCPECYSIMHYAKERIDSCILKEKKTTCAQCPVHCYKPTMRKKMKEVMRYAGPRMLYKHPFLTILHIFDGLKIPRVS
ncbi:MAG: nitrous oxide-stimulated promoter family protein [bacterium]